MGYFMSLHNFQCLVDVYLKYLILWLSQEYGTISVIMNPLTVHCATYQANSPKGTGLLEERARPDR